jgi:hypothetical protein
MLLGFFAVENNVSGQYLFERKGVQECKHKGKFSAKSNRVVKKFVQKKRHSLEYCTRSRNNGIASKRRR